MVDDVEAVNDLKKQRNNQSKHKTHRGRPSRGAPTSHVPAPSEPRTDAVQYPPLLDQCHRSGRSCISWPRLQQREKGRWKVRMEWSGKAKPSCQPGSLTIQWLGLLSNSAEGTSLIPGRGTKILHTSRHSLKIKKKKLKNKCKY